MMGFAYSAKPECHFTSTAPIQHFARQDLSPYDQTASRMSICPIQNNTRPDARLPMDAPTSEARPSEACNANSRGTTEDPSVLRIGQILNTLQAQCRHGKNMPAEGALLSNLREKMPVVVVKRVHRKSIVNTILKCFSRIDSRIVSRHHLHSESFASS
ncbi:hypothetical protein COOONC_23996 [Cooperia oncophora]